MMSYDRRNFRDVELFFVFVGPWLGRRRLLLFSRRGLGSARLLLLRLGRRFCAFRLLVLWFVIWRIRLLGRSHGEQRESQSKSHSEDTHVQDSLKFVLSAKA